MGDDPEPVAAGAAVRRVDADDTAGSTAAAPGVEVAFSFACGVGDVEIDGVDEETCPAVGAATTSDCGSAGDVGAETASDVSGAAAFAEPESVPVGSGVGSDAGYSAVPDPAAVVCAASVLCGAPVPGSAGAEDSPDEALPVAAVESSSGEAEFELFGDLGAELGLAAAVPPAEVESGESAPPEDPPEVVELDADSVSEGCASATGGVVTNAAPTPSTMTNAPTHPSYRIAAPCLDRTCSGTEHYAGRRPQRAVMVRANVRALPAVAEGFEPPVGINPLSLSRRVH